MPSWTWVWHSCHSVDIATVFRVPIYKMGKDTYVSTACGRGSCRTASTSIFRGATRDLEGWMSLIAPHVQGNVSFMGSFLSVLSYLPSQQPINWQVDVFMIIIPF